MENELNEIMKVLEEEGQSYGERRYKEIVAETVLRLLFLFDRVNTAVFVILGLVLGHILGNAF